ncbi:hypothetical protein NA78x_003044 [Anatilimnocola sp. NA78]|uniref:hypothetical protein n=1 Tax=Anatilimnocola sp. NA78 TaxID=3415683 RepID=UPI003CE463A2
MLIAAAGGSLVLMLLLVAVGIYWMWPAGTVKEPQPLAANSPPASLPGPPPTVPAPPASVPIPTAATPVKVKTTDTSTWVSLPDEHAGIQLKFPTKPAPFDLLEGQSGTDREFGEAILKSAKPTALRASAGGKTFSFTLMPLPLSGMPVDAYLNRALVSIELMNQGFTKQSEYRPQEEPITAVDAVLRSEVKTRIVRISHDGERAIGLVIEGPLEMTYEDPQVQAFLSGLRVANRAMPAMQIAGAAPTNAAVVEAVIANLSESLLLNPLLLPQSIKPLTNDWQAVRGSRIGFQVRLPSAAVTHVTADKFFAKSPQLDTLTAIWKESTTGNSEIFYLNQGTRRFVVVALEVPTKDQLWFDVRGQGNLSTELAYQFFTKPNTTWQTPDQGESSKSADWTTYLQVRNPDQSPVIGTRIMQKRTAGQYGFLLVLESDEPLEWEHSPEMQFFKDFVPPADAMKFE